MAMMDDNVMGDPQGYTLPIDIETSGVDQLVDQLTQTSDLLKEMRADGEAYRNIMSSTVDTMRALGRATQDNIELHSRWRAIWEDIEQMSGQVFSNVGASGDQLSQVHQTMRDMRDTVASMGGGVGGVPVGVPGGMIGVPGGGGYGGGGGDGMGFGGVGGGRAPLGQQLQSAYFTEQLFRDMFGRVVSGVGRLPGGKPLAHRLETAVYGTPAHQAATAKYRKLQRNLLEQGKTEEEADAIIRAGGTGGMEAGELAAMGETGVAAAAILPAAIAYAGYRAARIGYGYYEQGQQLRQQYEALTGDRGPGAFGQAIKYEARARLMALSPFLSDQQAHEIIQAALGGGYTGQRANTVIDFIANNVKNGVMGIKDSLDLYTQTTDTTKESVDAVTGSLHGLQDAAAGSQASLATMTQTAMAQNQALSAIGGGAGSFAGASTIATLFSGASTAGARAWAGPDWSSLFLQSQTAAAAGVSIDQLPLWMHQHAGETPEITVSLMNNYLRNFGIRPGATQTDILAMGRNRLIAMQTMMATQGMNPPQNLDDFAAFLADAAQGGPGRRISSMNRQLQPRHIGGRWVDINNRRRIYQPPGVELGGHLWSAQHREADIVMGWYQGYAARHHQTLPYLERMFQDPNVNFRDLAVRDPNTGRLERLSNALQSGQPWVAAGLKQGTLRMTRIPADHSSWLEGGGHVGLSAQDPRLHWQQVSGFTGAPNLAGARGGMMIGLSPAAQQWFHLYDPGGYYSTPPTATGAAATNSRGTRP
jgi:hypothetical protein